MMFCWHNVDCVIIMHINRDLAVYEGTVGLSPQFSVMVTVHLY